MAVVAGLLAVAVSSGCAVRNDRGQSSESATQMIRTIEGISTADVSAHSNYNGLHQETTIFVSVTIGDGYAVQDGGAFLNYLVAVGWSMNERNPNRGIAIFIDHERGPSLAWNDVAKEAGWTIHSNPYPDMAKISFGVAERKLGSWPRAVPTTPTGLLSR